MSEHRIRAVEAADAARIAAIYNHYVVGTIVTFEEEPVAAAEMARRIERVSTAYPWLVCEGPNGLLGYAYAAAWHSRCAYRLTVETTVYVEADSHRQGVGTTLYAALLAELRRRHCHCAIGAIALPNEASVTLHERCGFAKVGHFREVGWKLERWIDVGYWQLRL